MASSSIVDVADLLETRKVGRYQIAIWALAFLMVFVDGLDLSGPFVAAPALLRVFHVEKSTLGLVFGLTSIGALIGTYSFGYINDWFGRRRAAIAAVLLYSIPAIAAGFSSSITELMVLRFLVGLGAGGVMPTAIAYLVETAPKRVRVTFVMVGVLGLTCGIAAMGQVGAWLLPHWGWPVVFIFPGFLGLGLTAFLYVALPESLRYLTLHQPQSPALRRRVTLLAPELVVGADTRFVLPPQPKSEGLGLKPLFSGNQRVVTPLLWAGYLIQSITFMAFGNWFAVLLEGLGLTSLQASLTFTYGALLGVAAQILVARVFDKVGPKAIVFALLTASGGMILLGIIPGLTPALVMTIGTVAYAFCHSSQGSFNGMVGVFYPTNIRGKGVGYASGLGRAGQAIGPVAAGYMLSSALPLHLTLYLIATPYIITAFLCLWLSVLYHRHFAAGEASAVAVEPARIATVAGEAEARS
jgi:MFS transporter, AAHS family, 4-hydroxybenzoate transporter